MTARPGVTGMGGWTSSTSVPAKMTQRPLHLTITGSAQRPSRTFHLLAYEVVGT